jgi:hypothetical protein
MKKRVPDWGTVGVATCWTAIFLIAIVISYATDSDLWDSVQTTIFAIICVAMAARLWYMGLVEYSYFVSDEPDESD